MEYKVKTWQLKQRQGLPLKLKVRLSKQRIREWYNHFHGNIYISFSGGIDSTVLLHIARDLYPDLPAVFNNTGLQFPETRKFIKTKSNIKYITPKKTFKKVIENYGYPVISKDVAQKIDEIRNTNSDKLRKKRLRGDQNGNGKIPEKWKPLLDEDFKISHKCCYHLKKGPIKKYENKSNNKPMLGIKADDSMGRKTSYLKKSCNSFDSNRPVSKPLAFWTDKDIWDYIDKNNLNYSSIYNKGWDSTGCMFCMFGAHLEKEPNRFQRMKKTHPNLWDYCINKLGCGKVLDAINVNYGNEEDNYIFDFIN